LLLTPNPPALDPANLAGTKPKPKGAGLPPDFAAFAAQREKERVRAPQEPSRRSIAGWRILPAGLARARNRPCGPRPRLDRISPPV